MIQCELLEQKVIKKQKALPPIKKDEEPFDIPKSWKWVRLGELAAWGSGTTPSRKEPKYYENAVIPWVKTGDLNNGIIRENDVKEFISQYALENNSFTYIHKNNLIIAMYGATIGKISITDNNKLMVSNQACCIGKLFSEQSIEIQYIFYYMISSKKDLIKLGAGGAQPNISKQKIIVFSVPLPPLHEQKRIVQKVKEIFSVLK